MSLAERSCVVEKSSAVGEVNSRATACPMQQLLLQLFPFSLTQLPSNDNSLCLMEYINTAHLGNNNGTKIPSVLLFNKVVPLLPPTSAMTSSHLSDPADLHDTYLSASKYRDIKLQPPSGQSPPKDVSQTTKPATFETILYQMKQFPGNNQFSFKGNQFLFDWQRAFKNAYFTSGTYQNFPISKLKLIIIGSSGFGSKRKPFPFVSLDSSLSKVPPNSTRRFLKLIHTAIGKPVPEKLESKYYDFHCLGAKSEVFFFNICFTDKNDPAYSIQFLNLIISNSQISDNLVLLDFRNPRSVALSNLSVCFEDEFRNHRDYWTYKGETPPAKIRSLNQLKAMYNELAQIGYKLDYEDKNLEYVPWEKFEKVQSKVEKISLAIEGQLSLLNCISGKNEKTVRIEQDQLAFNRYAFANDEKMTVVTGGKVKYIRIGDLGNAVWTEGDFELAVKRIREVDAATDVIQRLYNL